MELRPPDLVNLAPATDEEVKRLHLSHSSIGVQLACLKKYEWSYVKRLEKIDRPNALSMGSAFQKAIELRDPQAGADAYAAERSTFDQRDEDKLLVDMAIVYAASEAYLRAYTQDLGIEPEVEYRIRLRSPYTGRPSLTYDLVGAADGVIDHGAYLELVENKLQTRIDETSVRRVKLDRQVGLTAYALWRVTGKPVRIIRYRFTRKPSIRQKQNESLSEYVDRLKQDYVDRADWYLHEEQTFRSEDDLLLIEAELWAWAEQRRHATAGQVYPRNTSACADFGGCPYIDLCLGAPEAPALYREKDPR